jgi:hypothetical protein
MQKRVISSVHLAGESLKWSEVDTLERRAEVWKDVLKAAPGLVGCSSPRVARIEAGVNRAHRQTTALSLQTPLRWALS